MMMKKDSFLFACIPALVASMAVSSAAFAQAKPAAPSNVCVQDAEGPSSCASASSGAMKWSPGHYAMSDTRPTTPGYQDLIHSEMDDMAAVQVGGVSKMKGFEVNYTWYWLETSPGVYNTTLIDENIEHLKALSAKYGTTFRLIIQINDASPGMVNTQNASQPAPYSSATQTYRGTLPSYIHQGVSGMGSDVFTDLYQSSSQTYYHPALWRAGLMDRFIALMTFLGKRYDSSPWVEAIIPVGETSWALNSPPADLNDASWTTQMKRLVDALASSWPTTNKFLNSTWPPTKISAGALLDVTQYAASKKVGFGGPDILYGAYEESYGAQTLRGVGGAFGSTDYRATHPSAWQEQANYSNWTGETSDGIENYAYNTLRATHVIWGNHHTYGANATQNWSGVVSVLKGVNFRINSACPKSYSSCGTTK